jgi:hypothetical protein
MKKRPEILNVLEKIADPFLILGVFLLFVIPALTVMNLTPIKIDKKDDNVLGVAESTVVNLTENSIEEDGINVVSFNQTDDKITKIKVQHLTHSAGQYENLIFTAQNDTEEEKSMKVTSSHEITDLGTQVSLLTDDHEYILLKDDGTIYPASIPIEPDQTLEVHLSIYSPLDVNFTSYINLDVFTE